MFTKLSWCIILVHYYNTVNILMCRCQCRVDVMFTNVSATLKVGTILSESWKNQLSYQYWQKWTRILWLTSFSHNSIWKWLHCKFSVLILCQALVRQRCFPQVVYLSLKLLCFVSICIQWTFLTACTNNAAQTHIKDISPGRLQTYVDNWSDCLAWKGQCLYMPGKFGRVVLHFTCPLLFCVYAILRSYSISDKASDLNACNDQSR